MDRRQAIHGLSLLLGGSLSLPLASAFLAGCKTPPTGYMSRVLDPEMQTFVRAVADLIIPRTDTPGAVDAGVDRFLDLLLAEYYSQDESERFQRQLTQFRDQMWPGGEAPLDGAILAEIDADIYSIMQQLPGGDLSPADAGYRKLREVVITGYYTSYQGGAEELRQNPMGLRKADMPFSEIGRSWS
jgi:hypothetical protein